MELKIFTHGNIKEVEINGASIPNVLACKVTTSDSGESEVELKFKLDVSASFIEMSSN